MQSYAPTFGIDDFEFRLIFGRTRIEYDETKEYTNRQKHGYSLESAIHLFESILLPIRPRRAMTSGSFWEGGEVRHMHLVEDDDKRILMIVTTMRADEVVRIISVRGASDGERKEFYAEMTKAQL